MAKKKSIFGKKEVEELEEVEEEPQTKTSSSTNQVLMIENQRMKFKEMIRDEAEFRIQLLQNLGSINENIVELARQMNGLTLQSQTANKFIRLKWFGE